MKSNLILNKYDTKLVNGTNCEKEFKTFFGSKMIDIEDMITIDDNSIQYSDVLSTTNDNGFQYFTYNNLETLQIINLSDIKIKYTTINLMAQNNINLINNTKWYIKIDYKKILQQYLFLKIKENRTFKCIYYEDLCGYDINNYIMNYIEQNIYNRYKYYNIDFYIKYINIAEENDIFQNAYLNYQPEFDKTIAIPENLISDTSAFTTKNDLNNLNINYYQTKDSKDYKFNYYFNLYFTKI